MDFANLMGGSLGGAEGGKAFGVSQATTTIGGVTRPRASAGDLPDWLPWAIAGAVLAVLAVLVIRR